MMIESTRDPTSDDPGGPSGVHVTPLLGRWEYPTETFVTAYRVKTATQKEKGRAIDFAMGKVGLPYDDIFAVKQLNGDSYYCSELVWAAYYSATRSRKSPLKPINLGGRLATTGVAPDDIARDTKNVKFIGGHWECYPPKYSTSESCIDNVPCD